MANKVLVVDDEKNIRESLVELIESENFAVESAADGADAGGDRSIHRCVKPARMARRQATVVGASGPFGPWRIALVDRSLNLGRL